MRCMLDVLPLLCMFRENAALALKPCSRSHGRVLHGLEGCAVVMVSLHKPCSTAT